jgi:hypothetical protein
MFYSTGPWDRSHKTILNILLFNKLVWKELNKCLDEGSPNVWSADINLTTSTLSSCTCSFEGQATLNEY